MSEALEQSDLREGYKTVQLGPREIPIPSDWDVVPFDEAIDLNPKYAKPDNGPFDYLPMDAVDEEKQTIEYWTQREKDDCTTTWFKNGDTVYAKITPCTENGKITFIDGLSTEVGSGSTEFLVFHPREGVTDERFVYYLSNLPEFRSVTISLMEGSTGRQRVPSDVFKGSLNIPHPPLPEQRRVADILSTVDEQIQQTDEIVNKTEDLQRGVLNELIPRGINERGDLRPSPEDQPNLYDEVRRCTIPTRWEISSLQDLCKEDVTYGIVQAGPHVDDGVPYIKTGDMTDGKLELEGLSRTSPEIAEDYDRSRIRTGELVITIRATVGVVHQVPRELDGGNLTQGTARISPKSSIDNRYLLWAIRSNLVQSLIDARTKGSTFNEITLRTLRNVPIPHPVSLKEQNKIAERMDAIQEKLDKERSYLMNLQELKRGLMQDLLTGKVRVSTD